jgi:hypothetical protein
MTLRKSIEVVVLEKEKNDKRAFVESPDTLSQVNEHSRLLDAIAEIENIKMPVTNAYFSYKTLNTVTAKLIDSHVWAPVKANQKTMEFKSLTVTSGKIEANLAVKDASVLSDYMESLRAMTTRLDKYGVDKPLGAEDAEGDTEALKFKDQFALQLTRQTSGDLKQPYEGSLYAFINKNITEEMEKLLGSGK